MISIQVGSCKVDILPVVNGLVSEAEKVKEVFGKYEAYAASLGIEGLEALKKREEIGLDDIEVSELDIVYSEKMAYFGEVQAPSPAFCEIVDLCSESNTNVIPLDMNDFDYDEAYMKCVSAIEFTSAHRLAKKGYKKKMDLSSPEALAIEWDAHVSKSKGFSKLNRMREEHIAKEIRDIAKYRSTLLCVIEVERCEAIRNLLEKGSNE
ncbi:MAG: hypothetical protein MJZ21_04285 [archaeon]|nr:hypothetical protein [archaeon]